MPDVIELDRNQPEFTLTFDEYVTRVVPDSRVERGRSLLAEHADLLERVAARYAVQPRFIVALWGVESDFGRRLGTFHVPQALATLAFDGRRSEFFRRELLLALRILEDGHIEAKDMLGSWAGAMGQSQFMPSSFVTHAVDENSDGRTDIWGTQSDVFASIANYLSNSGWRDDQTWGREVTLPDGFDPTLIGPTMRQNLLDWHKRGVRRVDGGDLPHSPNWPAYLVRPDGETGRAFLVYGNYDAILKWNRSTYFATAVGLLSDRLAAR